MSELPTNDSVVHLSGPDREGRVAYLSTSGTRRSTHVWIDTVDPSPPVQVFPLREGERHFSIGDFELSPVGGRLAFISYRASRNFALEVLDLASGEVRILRGQGCSRVAWFPDGRRLVFAEHDGTASGRGAIRIVDLESGELGRTWDIQASVRGLWVGPGGRHVYVSMGTLWRLDVETGQRERWGLPGLSSPIAFSEDGQVLGFALPTEGSSLDYTHALPSDAMPGFAVKLFDPSTGEFCTVSPRVGRRCLVSAGESAR